MKNTFGKPYVEPSEHLSASYGRQVWERNGGENDQDWQAFQAYRESGYPNGYDQKFRPRKLPELAATLGRSVGSLKAAASTHTWHERAGAFDAFLDRRRLEQGMTYHARTQYAQARALDKMHVIWEAGLDAYQAKIDSGEGLNPREQVAFGDMIIKNQRLISGQSTENVSVKHTVDLNLLTDQVFVPLPGETQFQVFERLSRIALGSSVNE